MAGSRDNIAEDLARSLGAATSLMQNLMGDIRDNAANAAAVKSKVEALRDSVAPLLCDVGGKGAVITRIALVENEIEALDERLDIIREETLKGLLEIKDAMKEQKTLDTRNSNQDKIFRRDKLITKLKLAAVIAPGVLSLIILLAKFITGIVP